MDKWDYMKLKPAQQKKWSLNRRDYPQSGRKYLLAIRQTKEYTGSSKKLNYPKLNEPIKKWATELKRTFSKEEVQMAKKHMKKCSSSLAIKEMQIQTTLRFYVTRVRMASIKNTTNNKFGKDEGEKEPSYTAGGNVS
jgi:hypothetical protein